MGQSSTWHVMLLSALHTIYRVSVLCIHSSALLLLCVSHHPLTMSVKFPMQVRWGRHCFRWPFARRVRGSDVGCQGPVDRAARRGGVPPRNGHAELCSP